jgi:hypothetical protein
MIVYDVKKIGHMQWRFLTSGKRECLASVLYGHLDVQLIVKDKNNGCEIDSPIVILEGELGSYDPSWDEVFTVISKHEIDRSILASVGVKATSDDMDENLE